MADQHFVPHIFFGLDPMVVSTVILVVTYGVIIWDKLNRAIVALLGASVMVVIGALDQSEALKGIDWNTLGLLTGMMILVSISRRSGMFEYLAVWSAQKAKAHPAGILLLLQITTAVVSALLDNVTTVLLVVPVTLAITRELDVPPYPFLFAEVFASNIGGTATLIGDPPNILIGSLVGLDFNAFIIHLTPVIIVVMAAQALMIHLVWGKALKSTPARRALVMGMNAPGMVTDWVLLRRSVAVLAAVLVAFVFSGPLHLEPATIAPMSIATRRLPRRPSGTSPATMRCARPSTIAVLPTPGSPISTGLFLVRRERTCTTRRISSSRPMTGSSLALRASSVRSFP